MRPWNAMSFGNGLLNRRRAVVLSPDFIEYCEIMISVITHYREHVRQAIVKRIIRREYLINISAAKHQYKYMEMCRKLRWGDMYQCIWKSTNDNDHSVYNRNVEEAWCNHIDAIGMKAIMPDRHIDRKPGEIYQQIMSLIINIFKRQRHWMSYEVTDWHKQITMRNEAMRSRHPYYFDYIALINGHSLKRMMPIWKSIWKLMQWNGRRKKYLKTIWREGEISAGPNVKH